MYEKLNLPDGEVLTGEHIAHLERGIFDADTGIRRIESLKTDNEDDLVQLRDLESGTYVLYGYFSPFSNSHTTIVIDNKLVHVAHLDAGSHLFVFNPLNAKIDFLEILVDDTKEAGFTFNKKTIEMLELDRIKRTVYLTAQSAEYEQVPCHITTATGDMTIDEINAQSTNGVTGWVETPVNVSADAPFCYAATAYFENGVWGNFSRSVQIGRYEAEE